MQRADTKEEIMEALWDSPAMLERLELKRDMSRIRSKGSRISFDCFNLHCKGIRAYCTCDIPLDDVAADRMLPLISVLRGWTSGSCKKCPEFDG